MDMPATIAVKSVTVDPTFFIQLLSSVSIPLVTKSEILRDVISLRLTEIYLSLPSPHPNQPTTVLPPWVESRINLS